MSRFGVLAAGFVLLIVGGGLLAIAFLLPESLLILLAAGLFGIIVSLVGLVALVAGTWIAIRTSGTSTGA